MRHRVGLLLALAMIVSIAAAPPAVGAPETTTLPTGTIVDGLNHFYAMAVTRSRIFLTPGPTGSTIAIMNPDGTQAGTITDVPGASGATVVDHVLYVAAFQADEVRRFDLSTDPPSPMTALSTSPLTEPRDLAFAGGHLWFTSGCDQWGARVGWMTLDGASVQELIGSNGDWNYCTAMEANRYAPNRIFLHSEGVSPQNLFEFNVKRTTPHLVTTDPWSWGSYSGQPVTPLPGGDEFAMYWSGDGGSSSGGPGVFSMSDMAGPTFSYTGQRGVFAVTAQNGGLLAGSWGGPYVEGEVMVWRLGATDPLVRFDFRDEYPEMWGDGLAFSPDGTELYAVTGAYDDVVDFRVLDPSLLPSTVTIHVADSTIDYGSSTTVTVNLEGGDTNHDVTLLELPWSTYAWHVLGTTTVDANGDATFEVAPAVTTAYEADYAGDATYVDAGSDFLMVLVRAVVEGRLLGAYAVENGIARFHDVDTVTYAVHVAPSTEGSWIHGYLQMWQFGAWRDVKGLSAQESATGDATVVLDASELGIGRYRIRAAWSGNASIQSDVSHWARFRVTS